MTDQELQKVDQIVDTYSDGRQNLIHVLQDMNSEFGYLPEEGLRRVSKRMVVPLSEVCGMATFFRSFRLKPRGRHLITVCMGTACHVRGAPVMLDEARGQLGVEPRETTDDRVFSLECVNCLGACAIGPVVVLDGVYHHHMTPGKLRKLIRSMREQESVGAADA